jgi:hypothetical protein
MLFLWIISFPRPPKTARHAPKTMKLGECPFWMFV